jgi:hypothetical protein
MRRFQSPGQAQRFLELIGPIRAHSVPIATVCPPPPIALLCARFASLGAVTGLAAYQWCAIAREEPTQIPPPGLCYSLT